MRYVRILLAGLIALAAAHPAAAQLAAPSLNPVTILGEAPFNPAALTGDSASRIAGGAVQIEFDTAALPLSPAADGDGTFVQALLVGESFAVGVAQQTVELDLDPALGLGNVTIEATFQGIGLAWRFLDAWTIGIGQEHTEESFGTTSFESDLPLVGLTVRLGESLYFGVTGGTETKVQTDTGTTEEQSRGVLRYSAAYHWREGTRGLHLEIYAENRDSIDYGPALQDEDESQGQGFTFEFVLANVLVGYESIDGDNFDPLGVATGTDEGRVVTIGWAPEQGLSIVASHSTLETLDTAGVVQEAFTSTVVGIGWLF